MMLHLTSELDTVDWGELAGVIERAISDRVSWAVIFDVVVEPEYQGKGRGRAIVESLVQQAGATHVLLHCVPGKEEFYGAMGFRRLRTAMRSAWASAPVAALVMSLTACVSPPQSRCHGDERRAVEDTVYFGTRMPNGVVSDEAWSRFLGEVVTPRFPRGLTVADASGQWLSANGSPVREATHVLQLVHSDDEASDAALTRVIAEYKTRFAQESVLRVKVRACVAF